jgi:hypothetical protein
MEELRKRRGNLSHDSPLLCCDLNLRPPEYEARVSTIHSEITFDKIGGGGGGDRETERERERE